MDGTNAHFPTGILSDAIELRAAAYRRWRRAADVEAPGPVKTLYEALARFECDRYEELLSRFLGGHGGAPVRHRPHLELPAGNSRRAPLRAAAVAAEAERRRWTQRLRKTGHQAPERGMIDTLIEDARRARDLVAQR